jgi:hypothetical protein
VPSSVSSFNLQYSLFYLYHILLMWRIYWAPNSTPIYIQQDVKLYSLFISGNSSTCFGWYFHISTGANTTVFTAPGICHTVTAICRYRGRVGTGLSVLWVAYGTWNGVFYRVTRLWHGRPRKRGWIYSRNKKYISPPKHSEICCCPPIPLFSGYQGPWLWSKAVRAWS